MCHLHSLSDEQLALFHTLPRLLRARIENTLDQDVPTNNRAKTRATFERILKSEGIALPEPGMATDERDLALSTYTAYVTDAEGKRIALTP
jgi:hypothetical protein